MKIGTEILQSLLFCSLILLSKNTLADGPGSTGAQILEVIPDAKTSAMGETYSGLDSEICCLYYNPAGLAYIDNTEVTFSNEQWQGMSQQYGGIAYNLHDVRSANIKDLGTIAVAFSDLNSGQITGRDALGNLTGGFYARDQLLIGAYAKSIFDGDSTGDIALGASVKFVTEEIMDIDAKAMAIDLGIIWKIPDYNFSLGISRQNIGQNIKYDSEEFALPANTKYSASLKPFDQKITINADMNEPDDSKTEYNFGAEYNCDSAIYLRVGYNSLYSDIGGLTTGIGLSLKQLDVVFLYASEVRIDYAFIPDSDLGNMNKISITMKLGAD